MTHSLRPGAKLIRPDDLGHGLTTEQFSALVSRKALDKVEATLGITSPSDGFRRSLTTILWRFYLNSLPEAELIFSRTALKKELRRASRHAEKLQASAARIWRSRDAAVIDLLQPFGAMWQAWQSSKPMRRSGVAWVALLEEFGHTTRCLAETLPDDLGGPRPAVPFDELAIGLADYHRAYHRAHHRTASDATYFRFVASVVDVLRKVEKQLPAAKFKLPPNDNALRKRLRRLAARRRRVT